MTTTRKTETLQSSIHALEPWFHNLHLPDGSQTAPEHVLGDFPANKWEKIAPHLPEDLAGWTVLDIGCNAGFYSFELARRGAQVTAIDCDPHYLEQARWAAEIYGLTQRVTFERMQIYELARRPKEFDLVFFMGVFYHLRYPILGLDIIARKTRRMLVFQTMTAPGEGVATPPRNLGLEEREQMSAAGWPKMCFIEHRLADDPTNWWAANHACVLALLRTAAFEVLARPAHEVYICRVGDPPEEGISQLLNEEYLSATGQGPVS